MLGGLIMWLFASPFVMSDGSASSFYKNSSASRKQDFSDLLAVMSADKVSKYLRKLVDENLGLEKIQTALKEKFYYEQNDDSFTLRKITNTLTEKLNALTNSLDFVIKEVLESYKISPYDVQVFRKFKECCALDKNILRYNSLYGISVDLSSLCEMVPSNLSPFAFHPRKEILEAFETNLRARHSLHAIQYFISMDGLQVVHPAHQSDSSNFSNCLKLENEKHSSIFVRSLLPFNKRIVILIDRGSAMSHNQIETAKCVFKSIIGALTDQDEVAVILIGSEITKPGISLCSNGDTFFHPITSVKEQLTDFVYSMKRSSEHTNHTAGFLAAFDLLINYRGADHTKPMILYLSRGLFAQLTDGTSVMTAIAESNLKMSNKVQINTIALTDVSKAIMWEATFLRDVAAQNFQQYAQSFTPSLLKMLKSRLKPPEGKMISINSSYTYCITKKDIYDVLRPAAFQLDTLEEKVSLTFDTHYPDFRILSFGKPILHQDHVLGVVGIDVPLEQLLSPIIHYSTSEMSSYAFAYEATTRRMLVHPKIFSSSIDASILENMFPFDRILSTEDLNGTERSLDSDFLYHWRKVQNTPLILVIATKASMKLSLEKALRSNLLTNSMTYNRIDLSMSKDSKVCLQGQVLFNTERCGLYLSPKCFEKSFERIRINEDLRSTQGYWAYVTDQTKLITNPGLKNERLRYQIAEYAQIISPWCRKHYTNSSKTTQLLRKYLATANGILMTHPAFPVRQSYEPSKEQWFQMALKYPGKLVFSQPILDSSGSGYIVPISSTLLSDSLSEQNRRKHPIAVVSVHVPVAYLYQMVNELASTACRESNSNVECILFNDRGYVVAYRSAFLAEDGSIGRVYESMHIAHKEPVIAAEILQHKDFVYKATCNDYNFRSIQRHYVLNTSYKDVVKSGDACRRYQITTVPDTNVFLAIVDRSCSRLSTFCPCSVLDRKCLNCLRADPLECECPCECSTTNKQGTCGDDSEIDSSFYQNCDSIEQQLRNQDPALMSQISAPLSKCSEINCLNIKGERDCLLTIGCEWCTHREGYRSSDPFCASVSFCYGGEVSQESVATECTSCLFRQDQLNASTPIGPVAGGIMAIFVFLVFVVLWYRHKVSRLVESSRSRYATSSGSGCRLNASDDMDGEFSFDNDKNLDNIQASDCATRNTQATCLLLTSFERENLAAVPVNPRPFWRRGPRTESSDPGYSTMTGGNCDDSEQATVYGDDSVSPRRTDNVERPLLKIGWPKSDGRVSKFSDNITESSELIITDQEGNDEDAQEKSFASDKTLIENNTFVASDISDSKTCTTTVASATAVPENDGQTILHQDSGHVLTTKAIVHAVDVS